MDDPFGIDLRCLGRTMPRRRQQNGFVKPTGKSPRTWTGYWYEYRIVDGKEKKFERSKVIGPRSELTKTEAKEKLKEIIRGGKPVAADSTFAEAAERYLTLKKGDWGQKQRGVIASIFNKQIIPILGRIRVSDLKPTDIKAFFNAIAESGSESLVKKCVTHVRAVFEFLIEDGAIPKNPAKAKIVTMPRTRKPSERFLELWECRALMGACESRRDHVIVHTFLSVALRPGEAFALRLDDVFPGQLRIDEAFVPCVGLKETKTEEADGFVPLPPALEAELRAYIREEGITQPREFLFASEVGTAMSHDNYLDRKLKPIAKRAGLKGVNFQVLRRTVATHFQKHGDPKATQGLLRHKRIQTTLDIYQKRLDPVVAQAAASWSAALNSGDAIDTVQ